jgi:hypothetical protein
VVRFAYQNGDLKATKPAEVIIPELPTGGHPTARRCGSNTPSPTARRIWFTWRARLRKGASRPQRTRSRGKAIEIEDIEARVSELERAAEAQKTQ